MRLSAVAHFSLVSIFIGLAPALARSAEIVVIVSANSKISNLDSAQVSNIFFGKVSSLPDGNHQAIPVDLPPDSSLREAFYAGAANRSALQAKIHWARLAFSGKGLPPQELPDSRAVKTFVANHPGSIGYVDKVIVDDSVKVVMRVNSSHE